MSLSAPSPELTVRGLRLIIVLCCLIALMGIAVGVTFLLWTDGEKRAFILLLVVLPLSVALFNWWVLRRNGP